MPTYVRRMIDDFNRNFYRCAMNPNGYTFQCAFCQDFYKTKSARLSHMKHCEENSEDEYDEENMLEEHFSVADFLHNEEVSHNLVKEFIRTGELEDMSALPIQEIRNHISFKLINNGHTNGHKMLTEDFLIYKFFFVVSEEEWGNEIENRTNVLAERFDF